MSTFCDELLKRSFRTEEGEELVHILNDGHSTYHAALSLSPPHRRSRLLSPAGFLIRTQASRSPAGPASTRVISRLPVCWKLKKRSLSDNLNQKWVVIIRLIDLNYIQHIFSCLTALGIAWFTISCLKKKTELNFSIFSEKKWLSFQFHT